MRRACTWLLAGVSRSVTAHVPSEASALAAATGAGNIDVGRHSPLLVHALPTWLASCLNGPIGCGCTHGTAVVNSRSICTTSHLRSSGDSDVLGGPGATCGVGSSAATSSSASDAANQNAHRALRQALRGKTPRHSRPPHPNPAAQLQPASRAAKEKGSKPSKQHSAKAAAWPPDGVRPLPTEDAHLVAAIPLSYKGDGESLGAVTVVGYHFVHPLPVQLAHAVVQSLIDRPLAGATLEGWHCEEARSLVLLRTAEQREATAREAEEGGQAGAGGPVSAVVLHSYGGVAAFNVPEKVLLEVLRRVADTLLHPGASAGKPRQMRLTRGDEELLRLLAASHHSDTELLRQLVADKLCKEEQKIVVNPGLRFRSRWTQKDNANNLYQLQEWDSANLESISMVVTKSAALRYHDKQLDKMLDRYEEVVSLVEDDSVEQAEAGWQPVPARGPLGRSIAQLYKPYESLRRILLPGKESLGALRQLVDNMTVMRAFLFCRLCVSEGPSRTWDSDRHYAVWGFMRTEYELDSRLDILMDKADLLKQSCLDRLSANNSTFTKRSEKAIILLIATEILISLTDLHGAASLDNLRQLMGQLASALGVGGGAV